MERNVHLLSILNTLRHILPFWPLADEPYGAGAMRRVQSLGDPAPLLETYCQETAATIKRQASRSRSSSTTTRHSGI
jgi:hypothetical protein